MKVLDLFSGIGGFSIGLERAGFKTVAFCEIDEYCRLVLKKHWKDIKIYRDVREITKQQLEKDGCELPEIITGGVPCQPFSVAGKQKGTEDNRHLWPEMFRVIQDFSPKWIIIENVRGLINIQDGMVFESMHIDLANEGYETQSFIIPAAGVGAPHRRERVWIIAHRKESMVNSDDIRFKQYTKTKEETSRWGTSTPFTSASDVGNTKHNGSPSATQPRSTSTTSNNNTQGKDTAWKSQGTSRSNDSEAVANPRRTIRGQQSSRNKESTGSGTSQETKWSADSDSVARSSEREKTVANSTESRSFSKSVRNSKGMEKESQRKKERGNQFTIRTTARSSTVANTKSQQSLSTHNREKQGEVGDKKQGELRGSYSRSLWSNNWDIEPDVGRVAHGIPGRVHRLKGLGNSIVPQIAEEIGQAIMKAELDSE